MIYLLFMVTPAEQEEKKWWNSNNDLVLWKLKVMSAEVTIIKKHVFANEVEPQYQGTKLFTKFQILMSITFFLCRIQNRLANLNLLFV